MTLMGWQHEEHGFEHEGRDDSIVEGYEESARKLWAAHVADVVAHGTSVLRVDEDGMRRAWDRAVARRDDGRTGKGGI